jgi:hypothetical protein
LNARNLSRRWQFIDCQADEKQCISSPGARYGDVPASVEREVSRLGTARRQTNFDGALSRNTN